MDSQELYRFTAPNADYFYTSANRPVVFQGEQYVPQPISRGSLAGASQDDSPRLEVTIDIGTQIVEDFAFSIGERQLALQLYEYDGDAVTATLEWEGLVTSISVDGRDATFLIPSRFGAGLTLPVPSVYYQSQCNHVLYDSRCSVARAAFRLDTTVVSIDQTSMVVASVGSNPNSFYNAGEVIRTSDGERRLITNQIGTNVTLNFPFKELNENDAIELYAGCDRSPQVCRDRFSNILNFGGHPFIPTVNVFQVGLNSPREGEPEGGGGGLLSSAFRGILGSL